jgi:hypothetical protein
MGSFVLCPTDQWDWSTPAVPLTVEERRGSDGDTVPSELCLLTSRRWTVSTLFTAPHAGSYLHWGVLNVSYTNLAIIGLMVVVFVLALFLPFGRSGR